jgi:hypothetical protein
MPMVTLPTKIPIAATGIEYPLSTGPRTFTEQDLRDAIEAATKDPAVKDPRLHIDTTLGHVEDDLTWEAGAPSFGYFHDLELSEDGQEILASLTTLDWLAEILPVVYPNRSLDGRGNVKIKSTGKKYGLVIDRVALLGVEMPGISTLDDLRTVLTNPEVTILAGSGRKPPKGANVVVRAQVEVEDVRREFYNQVAVNDKPWWWIRSIRLDPDEVIATDEDSGQLYRIPFSVTEREVTFGEAVAVYEAFVDEPVQDQQPLAAATAIVASWSNAASSRPKTEGHVDAKALRAQLGLPEDATDEQVTARITELRASADTGGSGSQDPPPNDNDDTDDDTEGDDADDDVENDTENDDAGTQVPAEGAPVAANSGTVTLDAETYAQLKAGAEAGAKARSVQVKARREGKVKAAIEKGKIPAARKKHYLTLMEKDEQGTTDLLASLAEGVIPVGPEMGSDDDISASSEAGGQNAYMTTGMTSAELARIARIKSGQEVSHVG